MKKILVFAFAAVVALFVSGVTSSAQYLPNSLNRSGGDFVDENGHVLTDQEIYKLIGDDVYDETYSGAVKQYKVGKALITAGSIAAGVGTIGTIGGAVAMYFGIKNQHIQYEERNGRYAVKGADDAGWLVLLGYAAGVSALVAGDVCLSVGIPLSVIGNKRLDWIAEDYNHDMASIHFGLTPHGAGLVLNF